MTSADLRMTDGNGVQKSSHCEHIRFREAFTPHES